MLDGSSIAAILTGLLALIGAVATAYLSGWNEKRALDSANRKTLSKYAVPLLIAAWDLANWFGDVLEDNNYSFERCEAYGNGWSSLFTSYLLGQYFAGVYILREKTHFLAHMRGEKVENLRKLLWKIQNEFTSMFYIERETRAMRWCEGHMLAVQEHMTEVCDLDGDGNPGEMRPIGWIEFQEKYPPNDSRSKDSKGVNLQEIFQVYEVAFQKIIYRRFQSLYSFGWPDWEADKNPQSFHKMRESKNFEYHTKIPVKEQEAIDTEWENNPDDPIMIPDHRIRRLQHLLIDLVELLDEVSTMKFRRPVDKCDMLTRESPQPVPCDCYSLSCNPEKKDFEWRQLHGRTKVQSYRPSSNLPKIVNAMQIRPGEVGVKQIRPSVAGAKQTRPGVAGAKQTLPGVVRRTAAIREKNA